jgi:hypothetical protein
VAQLDPTQIALRHQSGDSDRYAVFALLNVNGGDTADLAQYFRVVKRATLLGMTIAATASVSGISGTVITIPAGPSADAVILTVFGVAAG